MKVLHLGKFYPPRVGGMETHLQDLAARLKASIDVEILVANESFRQEISWSNGLQITRVRSLGELVATPLTWGLSQEIAKTDADIVHLHAPNPLAMIAFLRSGYMGKLVITHHGDIIGRKSLKRLIWPIWRQCMDRASAILVASRAFAESSPELAPYQHKWHIVPFGMDFNFLDGVSEQEIGNVRSRFPGHIVLCVGRLKKYKGISYLIDAICDVEATLLVIGKGPEETNLKRLAERLGAKVAFLGTIHHGKQLGAYYRAADLFVLPSTYEAFGLVQLEAMYCGLPVINTALSTGVAEVSIHGLTGLTVPPANSTRLSEAISTLLTDTQLRSRFSINAQQRAKLFTVESAVVQTLAVYESVLSPNPFASAQIAEES